MALAGLQSVPWFEWVPSKANPADLPSRPWPAPLRLPTLQELATPMIDVAVAAAGVSRASGAH